MPPEGNDDGFLVRRQNRRLRLLRAGRQIGDGGSLPPLCDRLRMDPIVPGEVPQALLTMLYRSTDRRCRPGAPVMNPAHSASFQIREKTAPLKPGTKHLVALAVECLVVGIRDFRLLFDGMQGSMPLATNAWRNAALSQPRSAMRDLAGGRATCTRLAPLWSLIWPSESSVMIGRPVSSQTVWSLEFSPPLMRPIRRGRAPF